jgi:HEAT repeat protein
MAMLRTACIGLVAACAVSVAVRGSAAEADRSVDDAVTTLTSWTASPEERTAARQAIRSAGAACGPAIESLLRSSVWLARRDALSIAVQSRGPGYARTLATGLKDRTWAVRAHAASLAAALPADRRAAVRPAVDALLGDEIGRVRLAAYKALHEWDASDNVLAKALTDPDAEVSYWAAGRFMQRARNDKLSDDVRTKLVDSILAKLRSTQWREVDNLSLSTLLLLGPSARRALVETVAAEPAGVRAQAVSMLGSRLERSGVDVLFEFVTDPDPGVRRSAAEYACRHAVSRHAERLVALLKSGADSRVRAAALGALGRLRHREALPQILELLTHYDENVRSQALQAVAQIGDKSVAPRLIQMYDAERRRWRRRNYVDPIAQLLGRKATAFLQRAIEDDHYGVRMAAVYAAKRHLSDADRYRLLIDVIRKDDRDSLRYAAINSLADQDAARAAELLERVLRDGGQQARAAAAQALARAGTAATTRTLIDQFAREEDPGVRQMIINSLGRVRDKQVVPVLKRALRSPDIQLRTAAIQALARFPDALDTETVLGLLRREHHDAVTRTCLRLLNSRRHADPRILPHVAKMLQAPDQGLRHEAVSYVVRVPGEAAARLLCKVIADDEDGSVRATAATGLVTWLREQKVSPRAIRDSLARVLKSRHNRVRRLVVEAVANVVEPETAPLLLDVLLSDDVPDIRRAAAVGVRRIATRDMVPKLLEAARAEDRSDTLAVLIDVLGEIGDRRALDFFRKQLQAADPAVQSAALRAVARFDRASLVPFYVQRFTQSSSQEVRLTSLRGLAGSGDRRAVPALLQAVRDDDAQIRRAALAALRDYADARVAVALLHRITGPEPDAAAMVGAGPVFERTRLRPVADDLLAASRRADDPRRRLRLLGLVVRMNDRRAAGRLAAFIETAPADEHLVAALELLGRCGDEQQMPLCRRLWRDRVGPVSRAAATALARLDRRGDAGGDVLDRFVAAATTGPRFQRRFYAQLLAEHYPGRAKAPVRHGFVSPPDDRLLAAWCRAVEPSQAEAALLREVASGPHRRAAVAAIEALARRPEAADATLKRILESSRPASVRAAALRKLAAIRTRPAARRPDAGLVALLARSLASDEPEIRLAAARAAAEIGRFDDKRLRAQLERAAGAGRPRELRAAAVTALAQCPGTGKLLVTLLDAGGDECPAKELIAAIGRRGVGDAVVRLTDRAESGPLAVRVAAIEALGRIATPAAHRAVETAFHKAEVDAVRAAAARALGELDPGRYEQALLRGLGAAPALDVRAACAAALAKRNTAAVRAALADAVTHDSGLIREAAVRALGARDPALLEKRKDDPDAGVARAVADVLREGTGR